MLYYSYTLMFSKFSQHCCYVVVCRFVRSLMVFVCQEIKGLLTYLLTYYSPNNRARRDVRLRKYISGRDLE